MDLAVSPQFPPDLMAAGAPTNAGPYRPQMPPPLMGVPQDLRAPTAPLALGNAPPPGPERLQPVPPEPSLQVKNSYPRVEGKDVTPKPQRKTKADAGRKKFKSKVNQYRLTK
jgi:hypothetical protein